MPLYEYECEACGQRFEVIQKFSDDPVAVCTKCGKGPVRKLLSSPAIQFKGSGWYITDYAQKGKSGGESSSSAPASSTTKGDDKKSDTSSSESPAKSDSTPAAAPAASSATSTGSTTKS